jgi:CheY-like chemotaxis protein
LNAGALASELAFGRGDRNGGGVARILIIEDDNVLRTWMGMTLRAAQHEVFEAESGLAALARARECPVDVVVTDVLLPADGIEQVVALREEFPATPFIVVTGLVMQSTHALEAESLLRARRVLAKPFTTADLQRAVAGVVSESGVARR